MEPAWRVIKHICVWVVVFIVTALAAWGLWVFTDFIREQGAPYHIWITSRYLSELLFGIDVFCFIFAIFAEAYVLIRVMITHARGH
jgi:hypothetical protein